MTYRTPSNISAASSMANINIYDNPTLNPAQAISRSRQGSKGGTGGVASLDRHN